MKLNWTYIQLIEKWMRLYKVADFNQTSLKFLMHFQNSLSVSMLVMLLSPRGWEEFKHLHKTTNVTMEKIFSWFECQISMFIWRSKCFVFLAFLSSVFLETLTLLLVMLLFVCFLLAWFSHSSRWWVQRFVTSFQKSMSTRFKPQPITKTR